MKQYTQSLFFLLFLLLTGPTGFGQLVPGGTSPSNAQMMGTPLIAGEHVANELLVRFDVPQSPARRVDFANKVELDGGTVQEWSPSFQYARVLMKEPFAVCDIYSGSGNPLGSSTGSGDQLGLNHIAGANAWESNLSLGCVGVEDERDAFDDYSPTKWCAEEDVLTPQLGGSQASIAIIDSGVRNAGGQGRVNGVWHRQVVVPSSCSESECSPIEAGIEALSGNFHPHGRHIYNLITGWFKAQQKEDQLRVTSYQVLDENLRCTLFQVIKALELITQKEVAQVVSLSIGFRPPVCDLSKQRRVELDVEAQPSMLYLAIEAAQRAGIIVVTSAGNDGNNLATHPQYPAAEVGLTHLVTVGAAQCGADEVTSWSNRSAEHVDLLAPGASVKVLENGCYKALYGTSFACPLVAAKAAFHITNQLQYDDEEVLCQLRSQALPDGHWTQYGSVNTGQANLHCVRVSSRSVGKSGPVQIWPAVPLQLTAAPNPVGEEVRLTLSGTDPTVRAELFVTDLAGRELLRRSLFGPSYRLALPNLKAGVYILHVATPTGRAMRTIIKQ